MSTVERGVPDGERRDSRLPKPFHWHRWQHPGVRSGDQLTFSERAADHMKAIFATWSALLLILAGMALWISTGGFGVDPRPFILLNLVLSCLAALQCFVLLIAAKRADRIAGELAQHDFEINQHSLEILTKLDTLTTEVHAHITGISA